MIPGAAAMPPPDHPTKSGGRAATLQIGDFNIDSRSAYLSPQPTVDTVLYNKLLSITK